MHWPKARREGAPRGQCQPYGNDNLPLGLVPQLAGFDFKPLQLDNENAIAALRHSPLPERRSSPFRGRGVYRSKTKERCPRAACGKIHRYPRDMRHLAMLSILLTLPVGAQTFNTIHTFAGGAADGALPSALTVAGEGLLYAVTGQGGLADVGIAFSLTPSAIPGPWTETILYNFAGGSGNGGSGPALTGHSGVLYGVRIAAGEKQEGTVFALTPPTSPGGAWTERLLYSFPGGAAGGEPTGSLTVVGRVLYGATNIGGTSNGGTVFSLAPSASPGGYWTETVLYSFAGPPGDGAVPSGGLVVGSGGVLYGTTVQGGTYNAGTVFSLTPPASPGGIWAETVLYNFKGPFFGDGAYPAGGLDMDADGVLYGTSDGGAFYDGMVFSLTPPASPGGRWTEAALYSFVGGSDGALPSSGVILSNGVLYGTTQYGGPLDGGSVFSLTPPASAGGSWAEAILHTFGDDSNGCKPSTGLVIGRGGALFGTTAACGNYQCSTLGCGTVFSVAP